MTLSRLLAVASVAALATGCSTLMRSSSPGATAVMIGASGQPVGMLRLEQTSGGVRITGALAGLPAGTHGIHIHAVGKCDGPAFTTAGGHYDLAGHKHGLENPAGPHAGDMPNIVVAEGGSAVVDLTTPRVSLDGSAGPTLFDADGSAVVIHAAADDQRTDPAGNAGARIACGVITKS